MTIVDRDTKAAALRSDGLVAMLGDSGRAVSPDILPAAGELGAGCFTMWGVRK